MPVLPLLERDLRVRASRGATYWHRLVVVATGIFALLLAWMEWGLSNMAIQDGMAMFNDLVVAAFLVCCSTFLLTAEALTAERREGTLELLFLTRVGRFDVLLGKLAACGWSALCGLLAFSPMLMVPVLAGGVSGGEAVRKGLALLALLILALVIGLRSSILFPDRFRAARNSLLLLGTLTLGPWAAAFLFETAAVGLLSPAVTVLFAAADEYQQQPFYYWLSLAMVVGSALLLLLHALSRFKLVPHAISAGRAVSFRNIAQELGSPANAADQFARSYDPIGWWVRRQPGVQRPLQWACVVAILHVIFDWIGIYQSPSQIFFWSGWLVASSLWLGLIGVSVGRFFYATKQSGELELLATTPLGPGGILNQQWRAMKGLLRVPIIVSIVAFLVHRVLIEGLVWGGLTEAFAQPQFPVIYLLSWLLDVLFVLVEVAAVAWVAIWAALKGRSLLGIAGWSAMAGIGPSMLVYFIAWYLVWQPLMQTMGTFDPWLWILQDCIEQAVLMIYFGGLSFFLRRRLSQKWPH